MYVVCVGAGDLGQYGAQRELPKEVHQDLIQSLDLEPNAFLRLLIVIEKIVAQSTESVMFNILTSFSP